MRKYNVMCGKEVIDTIKKYEGYTVEEYIRDNLEDYTVFVIPDKDQLRLEQVEPTKEEVLAEMNLTRFEIKDYIKKGNVFFYTEDDKEDFIQDLVRNCDMDEEDAEREWNELRRVECCGYNYIIDFVN